MSMETCRLQQTFFTREKLIFSTFNWVTMNRNFDKKKHYSRYIFFSILTKDIAAVVWLKYCRYGGTQLNQSIEGSGNKYHHFKHQKPVCSLSIYFYNKISSFCNTVDILPFRFVFRILTMNSFGMNKWVLFMMGTCTLSKLNGVTLVW